MSRFYVSAFGALVLLCSSASSERKTDDVLSDLPTFEHASAADMAAAVSLAKAAKSRNLHAVLPTWGALATSNVCWHLHHAELRRRNVASNTTTSKHADPPCTYLEALAAEDKLKFLRRRADGSSEGVVCSTAFAKHEHYVPQPPCKFTARDHDVSYVRHPMNAVYKHCRNRLGYVEGPFEAGAASNDPYGIVVLLVEAHANMNIGHSIWDTLFLAHIVRTLEAQPASEQPRMYIRTVVASDSIDKGQPRTSSALAYRKEALAALLGGSSAAAHLPEPEVVFLEHRNVSSKSAPAPRVLLSPPRNKRFLQNQSSNDQHSPSTIQNNRTAPSKRPQRPRYEILNVFSRRPLDGVGQHGRTLNAQHGEQLESTSVQDEYKYACSPLAVQKLDQSSFDYEDADFYRRQVWRKCGVSEASPVNTILIEQHGHGRRIWHRETLKLMLKWLRNSPLSKDHAKDRQIEIQMISNLTFCEQVAAFARSRIVIAHHGAAVSANGVFMHDKSVMVEVNSACSLGGNGTKLQHSILCDAGNQAGFFLPAGRRYLGACIAHRHGDQHSCEDYMSDTRATIGLDEGKWRATVRNIEDFLIAPPPYDLPPPL